MTTVSRLQAVVQACLCATLNPCFDSHLAPCWLRMMWRALLLCPPAKM